MKKVKITITGSMVVTTGVYNAVDSKKGHPWALCTPKYDLIDTDNDGNVDVIRYRAQSGSFELFPENESRLMVMANNLLSGECIISQDKFICQIEEYLAKHTKIKVI